MSDKDTKVIDSSGNIFKDLALGNPEERLAKAELIRAVRSIIKHRHLSQKEAGKILGITQNKVSDLVNGRMYGFSMEKLIHFINALDRDVEICIKKRPKSRKVSRVLVRAA